MKNYNYYYKAKQTRQPISSYQKCGFTHQRVYRVHFGRPTKRHSNFLLASSRIMQDCNIVAKGSGWLVYEENRTYGLIFLEGCDPTNKYSDFTHFHDV